MSQNQSLSALERAQTSEQNPFCQEERQDLLGNGSIAYEKAHNSNRPFLSSAMNRGILPGITLILLAGIFFLVAVLDKPGNLNADSSRLIEAYSGAVASENIVCSEIGVEMMKIGGSAVDAVVAATICSGSINSFSSGIGGGGFMLVRLANGTNEMINFREEAPGGASVEMYKGHPELAQFGSLSIAIPGELRGLELAHKRYGKLPWKKLVYPSVEINRNGFRVTRTLRERLESYKNRITGNREFEEIYAPNGHFLNEGDICYRKKYADTLEKVALGGADAFYKGEIADLLVKDVNSAGGILANKDLESYQAKIEKTYSTWYHGRKVITGGPPTSGPIILNMLNVMEGFDLRGKSTKDPLTAHRMAEAFKYAFALRGELGDPAFIANEPAIQEIISKDFAAEIRANISDTQTFEPKHYNPRYDYKESHGTMHISAVDKDDMAVSLMSTVNLPFGGIFISKHTGVMLNDEMDDFSSPNVTNAFGLPPSPNNFIAPYKRPMSSSVPIIVEKDGKFELAIGGSGGTKITTEVLQLLVDVFDFDMRLDSAVDAPRMHHQLFPNTLMVEYNYDKAVAASLESRGHNVVWASPELSQACVEVVLKHSNGTIHAVSDKRKDAIAAGY